MITHMDNPALIPHPNDLRPPQMAASIMEADGISEHRVVLSVGLNGELFGSVAKAIEVLEDGISPMENDVETAFLGFLRAIRKARETT